MTGAGGAAGFGADGPKPPIGLPTGAGIPGGTFRPATIRLSSSGSRGRAEVDIEPH